MSLHLLKQFQSFPATKFSASHGMTKNPTIKLHPPPPTLKASSLTAKQPVAAFTSFIQSQNTQPSSQTTVLILPLQRQNKSTASILPVFLSHCMSLTTSQPRSKTSDPSFMNPLYRRLLPHNICMNLRKVSCRPPRICLNTTTWNQLITQSGQSLRQMPWTDQFSRTGWSSGWSQANLWHKHGADRWKDRGALLVFKSSTWSKLP